MVQMECLIVSADKSKNVILTDRFKIFALMSPFWGIGIPHPSFKII
jgi:hypothetical protein